SFYLKPLEALGNDRVVIRYDQLGAGKSDPLTDTTKMTIAHFVAELDSRRSATNTCTSSAIRGVLFWRMSTIGRIRNMSRAGRSRARSWTFRPGLDMPGGSWRRS